MTKYGFCGALRSMHMCQVMCDVLQVWCAAAERQGRHRCRTVNKTETTATNAATGDFLNAPMYNPLAKASSSAFDDDDALAQSFAR